jgi:hypothetical protein
MTAGQGQNPFALPEDPLRADPPLNCASHAGPRCHVDVGGATENFELFEQRLNRLGRLQKTGLFVAVSGPSRCGKTSLINRCVAHATAVLKGQGIRVEEIDLTAESRNPNLTIDDRTRRVGGLLVDRLRHLESIFDPLRFKPPEVIGDAEPDLSDWTTKAYRFLKPESVAVILTPGTEHFREITTYWSSVYSRMLVFTECQVEELADACRGTTWEMTRMAQWICLETRLLTSCESKKFIKARIDVPGKNKEFPDLSADALEGVYGGRHTVGAAQTLLYRFYDHCLRKGWSSPAMDAKDLRRFIEDSPPGQMG